MLRSVSASLLRRDNRLLLVALVLGAASHGYHLFRYPLYLTDEGIYVQQAWSVLRLGQLSPYTYFYDHAPGGWLVLAAWTGVLPGQFETFGNAINTGRALMLLVHLASVFLLFEVARRFSGTAIAAFLATTFFSLSPLAIFYQRQVLLDNLMVFWLLLSLYLISRADNRITTALAAGLTFGLAVVTKENAVFFGPVLAFLLYRRIQGRFNRRFAQGFWFFAGGVPVAFYLMYATLKNELWPTGLNFDLDNPPADHVSLAYTVWWQLNRTALSGNSFLEMTQDFWLPKDRLFLVAGAFATVILLAVGLADRRRNEAQLIAALLTVSYALYMVRGSVLLEFYVLPLIPLLALNVGLVIGALLERIPRLNGSGVIVKGVVTAALVGVLLTPVGGYLIVYGDEGQLQAHDMYRLRLTDLQEQQLAWVRANVPPTARLIIDDDIWPALHDVQPYYPFAHSHWKATADPDVRDKLFGRSWRNVDYIIMSNKMRIAMRKNNSDGRENWIFNALDNHSERVWHLRQGDVELAVYRVDQHVAVAGSSDQGRADR